MSIKLGTVLSILISKFAFRDDVDASLLAASGRWFLQWVSSSL